MQRDGRSGTTPPECVHSVTIKVRTASVEMPYHQDLTLCSCYTHSVWKLAKTISCDESKSGHASCRLILDFFYVLFQDLDIDFKIFHRVCYPRGMKWNIVLEHRVFSELWEGPLNRRIEFHQMYAASLSCNLVRSNIYISYLADKLASVYSLWTYVCDAFIRWIVLTLMTADSIAVCWMLKYCC